MKKMLAVIVLCIVVPAISLAQNTTPGKFRQMLARSNGTWIGESTMQFSPESPRVNGGVSMAVHTMSSDGRYQISEVKGNIKPGGMGAPWTGLRITGYDSAKRVFTRAMIGDSPSIQSVAMEGQWDDSNRSITFPFKLMDNSGKERILKEVYRFADENTEFLEIYATDPKTNKEYLMAQVKWTRHTR